MRHDVRAESLHLLTQLVQPLLHAHFGVAPQLAYVLQDGALYLRKSRAAASITTTCIPHDGFPEQQAVSEEQEGWWCG